MAIFRRKPTTVEATRFIPSLTHPEEGLPDGVVYNGRDDTGRHAFSVRTLNGWVRVQPGDWVIAGKGEHYPCKPDVFAATYEPADGE